MPWHGTPRMILGRWLGEPHVSGVARQLSRLECILDSSRITNLSTSCIDNVRTAFHTTNEFVIKQAFRFGVEWTVDRHNITNLDHVLNRLMKGHVEFLLHLFWESVSVYRKQKQIRKTQVRFP